MSRVQSHPHRVGWHAIVQAGWSRELSTSTSPPLDSCAVRMWERLVAHSTTRHVASRPPPTCPLPRELMRQRGGMHPARHDPDRMRACVSAGVVRDFLHGCYSVRK